MRTAPAPLTPAHVALLAKQAARAAAFQAQAAAALKQRPPYSAPAETLRRVYLLSYIAEAAKWLAAVGGEVIG